MFTYIGPYRLYTFGLYISLSLLISACLVYIRVRQHTSLRATADVFVGALIGSLLLGRGIYVALNWDVFAPDITRIWATRPGGLNWHGSALGAVFGLVLVVRLRRLNRNLFLDAFAPALPLIAFAGWTACRPVGCLYGEEVATLALYPAWMVTEGPDIFGIIAPRYDTHTFGQGLALALLVLIALLYVTNQPQGARERRFWLIWLLFSVGMFLIGGARGDYALIGADLRADQWLDMGMAAIAIDQLVRLSWRYYVGLHPDQYQGRRSNNQPPKLT